MFSVCSLWMRYLVFISLFVSSYFSLSLLPALFLFVGEIHELPREKVDMILLMCDLNV
jgi:hypothetical protein